MGQRPDEIRPRDDIEVTREEMATTIDALQDRLDPEVLSEQARETAHDVTDYAIREAKEAAREITDHALMQAREAVVDVTGQAKLALREATARFLVESIKFDVYLKRAPGHVTVPVLLMLAGQDRIIDNARTRKYVGRFASRAVTVTEYPSAHHTLEFEPDPGPVFHDWAQWILNL